MKIKDLFHHESIVFIDRPLDTERECVICTDPDLITKDAVFFYPKRVNSSDYKLPKLRSIPYAVIVDADYQEKESQAPLVKVKNARRTLAFAYSNHYGIDYTRLKVIGVTGTNGKTSTATMLEKILMKNGSSVGYIGTGAIRINSKVLTDSYYSMTTPDPSILYSTLGKMQNEGCEYAVMEVSSHALSLYKCAPISFVLGIFTNLSSDHMDFHKTKEEYYKAKLTLFDNCNIGVFNVDDEYVKMAYNTAKCQKYSVGVINDANATVTSLTESNLLGTEFFYLENGLIFKLQLQLGGVYNVYNAILAAKGAIALGVRPCIVKEALCAIEKIDGRLEVICESPLVLIDYAHTAEAMENLLKLIHSSKKPGQNIIIVFGCGGDRDKEKRAIIGSVVEQFADKIIVTEDNSRSENFEDIKENILFGIIDRTKVSVIKERRRAIEYAIKIAKLTDIVAIVGKGHERYIIDIDGKHPFDEREIIYTSMAERMSNENKA